ncbi:hypothetical protein [Levilactobacillus tujiorum]|uniref:hypothetical protein n=1 Tax=Levilactobacillus tujiorum TaxID=2912243 RepID=UPI00145713D1|nr:hypothetical protein [Levilactobacillus tujiorum]NLR31427.1 hypothetical protein [Levilactobacillus tujiorum]
MKKLQRFIGESAVLLGTLCLVLLGGNVAAQARVRTKFALANYQEKKVKVVHNQDLYVPRPASYAFSPTYQQQGTFQTQPATYTTLRGNAPATLTTALYLPVTVHRSGDWANPQSLVITKNGKTAYVAYLETGSAGTGWIVKYDLAKLRQKFGATTTNMALIRRATNAASKGKKSPHQRQVLSAIKQGPKFDLGHGQSMALNPKNGQLWFTRSTGVAGKYGSAVRVSTKTLRPVRTVDYRLVNRNGVKLAVNSTLTFDRQGYAYFSSYSGKRALRIYRGTISQRGVHFKLVMQGLAYRPGQTHQSIAYNAKNNRLYFISDDAISSVPLARLLKRQLKPKDVRATAFASQREFEALAFTGAGQGYLMMNRGPELLQVSFK